MALFQELMQTMTPPPISTEINPKQQVPFFMEAEPETPDIDQHAYDIRESNNTEEPPSMDSSFFNGTASDSTAEIHDIDQEIEGDESEYQQSEKQEQQNNITIEDRIQKVDIIHVIDEERAHSLSSTKYTNPSKINATPTGNSDIDENTDRNSDSDSWQEEETQETKYKISQLVSITDPAQFEQIEPVYGIIVDIGPQKMKIEYIYDNESFRTEWFDVDDNRISVVQEAQATEKQDESDSISEHSLLNLMSIKEEMLSLRAERHLINLEREEIERGKEMLSFARKKHDIEVMVLKNDYVQRLKNAQKECNIYQQRCDEIHASQNNDYFVNHFLVTRDELEKKEKYIVDIERLLHNKENRSEILYASATDLLQKVQRATIQLSDGCNICDEKSKIEKELINAQNRARKKYLTELNEWLSSQETYIMESNIDELYTNLQETYETLYEQRRKFTVVQRKLRTVHPQMYDMDAINDDEDDNTSKRIRTKLKRVRKSEKEWKLAVYEQIKGLFDEIKMRRKQRVFDTTENEIIVEYQTKLMEDKQRQITNDEKMLRLEQKNLQNTWMELQCERAFLYAEFDETNVNIYDDCRDLEQKLEIESNLVLDKKGELQDVLHKNDLLEMQLTHFAEWKQEKTIGKEEKEQNYELLMNAMETLNKEFEQMTSTKDAEMKRTEEIMNEWKQKVTKLEKENVNLSGEKNTMMQMMEGIKDEHTDKMSKNDELNEKLAVVYSENEELKAEIQQLIMKNEEELKKAEEQELKRAEEAKKQKQKTDEMNTNNINGAKNSSSSSSSSRSKSLSLEQSVTETVETTETEEIEAAQAENIADSKYFVDDSMLGSNNSRESDDGTDTSSNNHMEVFWNMNTMEDEQDIWNEMKNNPNAVLNDLNSVSVDSESDDNESISKLSILDDTKRETEIKFAKKMRKHRKVKDSRERSFLVMCDENKMIDPDALYAYISHFGALKITEKMQNDVDSFFVYMKPNKNGFVSFSKFVHAIDEDGDVVAAYNRFKETGDSRTKKWI